MRRWLVGLSLGILGLLLILLAIDGDPAGALRGSARADSDRLKTYPLDRLSDDQFGAVYFTTGDFSALSTDALRVSATPWVVTAALLALSESKGDPAKVSMEQVNAVYRRYGFHAGARVENWPQDLPQPDPATPIGLNTGTASRLLPPIAVTVANIGCAACHSGTVYGADGRPDPQRIWLGTPNSSINLEGYVLALYGAMRDYSGDDAKLWQAIDRLFPDLGLRERETLKLIVLPALRKRLTVLEAEFGRAMPYSGGLPGATNGLDALKARLGLIPEGAIVKDSAFNSVPELGGRLWRSTLLNTGTYQVPGSDPTRAMTAAEIDDHHVQGLAGIVAFFTVPSMGVSQEAAEQNIGNTDRVLNWLRSTYRPQPYPKAIDENRARHGQALYAAQCASCHGTYSADLKAPQLESFPNWLGDVGTDPLRKTLIDQTLADSVNGSLMGRYIRAVPGSGYAAPPLSGIWSSAPYLHNGSVPTLWHLMHPKQRPFAFQVGGHALDLDRVGIAGTLTTDGKWLYAEGYKPWSEPVLVDTSKTGLGNRGHEAPFDAMPEGDKQDLIEYLKLL